MKSPAIISHFQSQAEACNAMGSPFTGGLCKLLIDILDDTTLTGKRIEDWPGDARADALALRLCGGFHAIALQKRDAKMAEIYREAREILSVDPPKPLIFDVLNKHDDFLVKWLELPPQTNETGRAGALLPGLMEISRHSGLPIELREIGSSAGLNLNLDRFFYDYGKTKWGDKSSPVHIKPDLRYGKPDVTGNLEIVTRSGCDISPIFIRDPEQQLRLRSYAWPDQDKRLKRLSGAIELAQKYPPQVQKENAEEFVRFNLENRRDNSAFVLMHSVVWQYLPQETKHEITAILKKYGATADNSNPIYWLRLEGFGGVEPHAGLLLDSWPVSTHRCQANSCFHGNWIEFGA